MKQKSGFEIDLFEDPNNASTEPQNDTAVSVDVNMSSAQSEDTTNVTSR